MTSTYANLYEHLNPLGQEARLDTARSLFGDLQAGNTVDANVALFGLCARVLRRPEIATISEPVTEGGRFAARDSAMLVSSQYRVSGFLNAIARATPDAERIIEVGTGASGLLAAAAALTHPNAKVTAYEINPKAAACARVVMGLLGLEERVEVIHADALSVNPRLFRADLGITETFGAALMREQGTVLTEWLSKVAEVILPAMVKIYVTNSTLDDNTSPMSNDKPIWKDLAVVDLAQTNTHVAGRFRGGPQGDGYVRVRAAFYDASGQPILTTPNVDDLTSQRYVGPFSPVPEDGSLLSFSYGIGVEPPAHLTSLEVIEGSIIKP